MTPDDAEDHIAEMLSRPRECSALEMELETTMELRDVARCRALLREEGRWLAKFKSHELTKLMDAAIRAESAADELLGLLLQAGVPAHSIYDFIGPDYQHTAYQATARSSSASTATARQRHF